MMTGDRVAALSGAVWGVIAYAIGRRPFGPAIWGGVLAAPLIGVLIGRISRRAAHASLGKRLIVALSDLYLSAILFGACVALGLVLTGRTSPLTLPAAGAEIVASVVWGLTVGYLLILWPLSFINHQIVWGTRDGRVAPAPRIPVSTVAIRTGASWLIALVVLGFAISSVFRLIGAGLSLSTSSAMPWWMRFNLMGWGHWFIAAVLFWLIAPAVAAATRRLTRPSNAVTTTYGEVTVVVGIIMFMWPIVSFSAHMIVVLVKVWLVDSWATEGQVFLTARYYRNVFWARAAWLVSGLALAMFGVAATTFQTRKRPPKAAF